MNLYDNNLNKNNQNNEQFYKIYNDSFKTSYKKKPSLLVVVLIVIACFFGIRFLFQLLTIESTIDLVSDARVGSFQTKANDLTSVARTYIITNNVMESGIFSFNIGSNDATWKVLNSNDKINVEKTSKDNLVKSPFGNKYEVAYVIVLYDKTEGYSFSLFLSDGKYCYKGVNDSSLNVRDNISTECKDLIQK